MGSKAVVRDKRIELLVTKREKSILKRAAVEECLDLTSFILRSALPAARDVINREDRIVLSERDTELVLSILEDPPKPTKAMLDAAARYLKDTRRG